MSSLYRSRRSQSGISLIEAMIGVLIGIIAVLAILRVFSLSEASRRSTSGSADAQNSGTLGLYLLQRDLRQAGNGISNVRMLGCSMVLRTGVTATQLAPIIINDASVPAGDAGTDTLMVISSTYWGAPEGAAVVAQPAQTQYSVTVPNSFAVGNRVIALREAIPAPCALTLESVTAVTTSPPVVTVGTGVTNMSNGRLYNLGSTPTAVVYAVRRGNLTMCDLMVNNCFSATSATDAAVWVPVASNIVGLRAQYARDSSATMDGIVDTYDQTAPASACQWARVLGARVALVARSAQYEKTAVTTAAPTWKGSATAAIVLSGTTNWTHYRYKVFETVATSRNIAWMGVPASC